LPPVLLATWAFAAPGTGFDLTASLEDEGPDAPPQDDSVMPVWYCRGTSACSDGSVFQASEAELQAGSAYQVLLVELPADWAARADGIHLDDFQADCSPGGYLVRRVDDCSQAGSRDGTAGDNSAGGNANRRGSPDGLPRQSVVDDTMDAAGDKDSTSHPNSRGCSKRGVIPSSIPIRPTPTGDCPPTMLQCRFLRQS
jgi:hypothetical protein